jgi:hypothetical protein
VLWRFNEPMRARSRSRPRASGVTVLNMCPHTSRTQDVPDNCSITIFEEEAFNVAKS